MERRKKGKQVTDSFPGTPQKTLFRLPFPVLRVHNSNVFKKMRHPKQEANNGFIGNCLFIVEERARTLSVPAAALRRIPMVDMLAEKLQKPPLSALLYCAAHHNVQP